MPDSKPTCPHIVWAREIADLVPDWKVHLLASRLYFSKEKVIELREPEGILRSYEVDKRSPFHRLMQDCDECRKAFSEVLQERVDSHYDSVHDEVISTRAAQARDEAYWRKFKNQ